jgi:hypothetical protein
VSRVTVREELLSSDAGFSGLPGELLFFMKICKPLPLRIRLNIAVGHFITSGWLQTIWNRRFHFDTSALGLVLTFHRHRVTN